MGTVYRAASVADGPAGPMGSVVAIKVFKPELVADANTFARFTREAELGMKIRHGNVVRTYEVGHEEVGGQAVHYLVMELVEGQTLRAMIAELGTLPEHLLYQVSDQALDALSAVHAVHMIHRDLKPDNLVVTSNNRVLLMDLGVARLQQEGRDLTRAGEFVGSLHYAAPEQFLDQDHVGPLADLYAFGVVLYEMATGKNPFGAADVSTLITQKIKGTMRRPRVVQRDLDPFLDEVIMTCLKPDPAQRFASTEVLRAVLREGDAGEWWGKRIAGASYPAAMRALKRLRPPREAPLVGRGGHLDQLHEAWEKAQSGEGRVATVTAAAGGGKSRLVHDFAEELVAPDGPMILAGHSLAECTEGMEGGPGGGEFLPWLKDAARERPVLLVLENLHGASPETLDQFDLIARSIAYDPVLLVGTWRDDAVEEGSKLHALGTGLASREGAVAIALPPFDRGVADELLRALVGHERTVRAIGRLLHDRSDGNPHILLEMLAHLKKSGALKVAEGGLRLSRPLDDIDLPQDIRELFAARLADLDGELRATVEGAAVIGAEFSASLLSAVTGTKKIRLLQRLASLERKYRLVASSGKNLLRFASHGLRQVVYDGIADDRRRELHGLCADAILEEAAEDGRELTGEETLLLVRQLLGAGRASEVGPRAPLASAIALSQSHPGEAVVFLGSLAPHLDPAGRADLLLKLASAYALLGRSEDRMRALAEASEVAKGLDDRALRARVNAALAMALLRGGDLAAAEHEANLGLEVSREAVCLHALGEIAWRRGDCPTAVARWEEALAQRVASGDKRGEAATLLALGAVLTELGETAPARQRKEQALAAYKELGDRRGEGETHNNLGNSWVEAHRIDEALASYTRAVDLAQETGNLPGEAAALYNRGRLLGALARIESAKVSLTRALDLYRALGDPGGEAQTLQALGTAISGYGERAEARSHLEMAQEIALKLGESQLLGRIQRHLAMLLHEEGERAEANALFLLALAHATGRSRLDTLADMGHAALKEGKFDKAITLLTQSLGEEASGSRALLSLCRLARAHKGAGNRAQAIDYAMQAEERIERIGSVAPMHGPEVYYTLGNIFEGQERAHDYIAKANDLLGKRTRAIQSIVARQHYLTMTWPNREILEEAKRLLQ